MMISSLVVLINMPIPTFGMQHSTHYIIDQKNLDKSTTTKAGIIENSGIQAGSRAQSALPYNAQTNQTVTQKSNKTQSGRRKYSANQAQKATTPPASLAPKKGPKNKQVSVAINHPNSNNPNKHLTQKKAALHKIPNSDPEIIPIVQVAAKKHFQNHNQVQGGGSHANRKKALPQKTQESDQKTTEVKAQESTLSPKSIVTASAVQSLRIPKKQGSNLIIMNQEELDALAEQYKDAISVQGVPDISAIKLTKRALEHVFGLEIMPEDKGISGFHHDYNLESEDTIKMFYRSSTTKARGICEGFLATSRHQSPVYKTFFPFSLTRQQVLEKVIESLQHIQKKEDKSKTWLLECLASDGMQINIVIDKENNEIITFFPVVPEERSERKEELKKLKFLFKKHFGNSKQQLVRQPLNQEESDALMKLYSGGLLSNVNIGEIDLIDPITHTQWRAQHGYDLPPAWHTLLLTEKVAQDFSQKYPGRGRIIIQPQGIPLHITQATLKKIFSTEMDKNFPPNLTRTEIMHYLKQVIENASPLAEYPHATFAQDAADGRSTLIFPEMKAFPSTKLNGDKLHITSCTSGNNPSDIFTMHIIADARTGLIENFYSLFN